MKEYNELSDSEKQLIVDWYNHPQVGNDIKWIQYALKEMHTYVSLDAIRKTIQEYEHKK